MLRNASVSAALVAALAACAGSSTSVSYPSGDHWTFPLVGALENGPLIAPVSINGKGPYLFVIDPDANSSAVDQQVVDEAKLELVPGPARRDEAGAEQNRNYVAVPSFKLGSLTVEKRQAMLVPSNFYNTDGRRVNGVIGRDILPDMVVFGFDRDQGLGLITTAKTFQPPPGAIAVPYKTVHQAAGSATDATGTSADVSSTDNNDASRIGVATRGAAPKVDITPAPRKVADAQLGGAAVKLHLDLGSTVSQLREPLWAKSKLTAAPAPDTVRTVDELASVRELASVGTSNEAALGAAKGGRVTVIPYVDKRFATGDVDGALGLDFFRPFAVFAAPNTFYLKPRGDLAATATARLGRWGADVPTCAHPGCVAVSLTAVTGGVKLELTRDPEAAKRPLEIFLGVTPAAGKTAAPLIAELPAGVDSISGGVPADYEGATVTVLDASAFTRPCAGEGGCVIAAPGQ